MSRRLEKRQQILAREKEFEDSSELLEEKCAKLAEAIAGSKHLVVYSGAGVSTAAKIPDYRGTNGIWTRLQQGKEIGYVKTYYTSLLSYNCTFYWLLLLIR